MFGRKTLHELSAPDLRQALEGGGIVLVDVREATEFASERIEGALNIPLSNFNPADLPDPGARRLVLQCASGKRSTLAAELCRRAGVPADAHLSGGIAAWKRAGLPVVRASGAR